MQDEREKKKRKKKRNEETIKTNSFCEKDTVKKRERERERGREKKKRQQTWRGTATSHPDIQPPSRRRHRPQPQRCNATLPSQRATALVAESVRGGRGGTGRFSWHAPAPCARSLVGDDTRPPGPSPPTRIPRGFQPLFNFFHKLIYAK